MAIYRGIGGAGDSTTDATVTEVTTQATNAAISAAEALSSASSASTSATSATNSASTATTKASEASTSASNAATSETNAATSATSASTSASNAASSASAASTSATNAAASESAASTSETNAATSETNAATSETNAASSATAASTSASNAATSESNASTSETNAATSATNAATSETNAQTAADTALSALDNFDDRYLGQKTSDPTLDNDGDALVAGALYFNTTDDVMKVYDGSAWVAAYASLSGTLVAVNNLSDLTDVSAARTNLGLGTAATTASTDYATAAQGTLADSAVQPADNVSTLTNDASYLTGNQTITLSGDASGSGTTAITVTVADDSHNHIIANVDGLQTALDAKGTLSNVVEDTTPQLGGNLDLNSNDITGTGSLNVVADSDYEASITATSNSSAANWARIDLINQNASAGAILHQDSAGTFTFRNLSDGSPISFQTSNGGSNAERMRINANGNVGIGTTSPTYKLHTYAGTANLITYAASDLNSNIFFDTQNISTGASAAIVQRFITSNVAGTGTTSADFQKTKAGALNINNHETDSAAYTRFGVGGSERMRINSSGNVGIGTTTPSTALEVNGTVTATTVDLGNWTITESAGVLYFATSGTNKMKLDASGNLTVTGDVTAFGTV